jgi:3-isopropylmalate dehydratase small subunit
VTHRIYEGTAWVFGDNVSTDHILPGRYLDRPMDEVGRYAMTGLDESFPQRVERGDIVVAGRNFGCGSSREAAVMALVLSGVAAVVARSFGRIFYRNAINNGFPAAIIAETAGIRAGDRVGLDLDERVVVDATTGERFPVLNLTGTSRAILDAGGIVEYTLARMGRAAAGGRP